MDTPQIPEEPANFEPGSDLTAGESRESLSLPPDASEILESISDAIYTLDSEWRFTYINARAEALLRRPRTALIGRNIWDEYPHAVDSIFYREYHRAAEVREPIAFDAYSSVLEAWLFVRVTPLSSGLSVLLRDITQRKFAEAALQERAAIVDASFDAVIGKTLDGIITSWNPSATKLYGYTEQETVGKHISLIIPPQYTADVARIMEKLRRGERIEAFETVRRHKNGFDVLVSLTISPIRDAHGQIIGASKIARDIGERKRAERAVQHMMEGANCLLWQADVKEFHLEDLGWDIKLASEQAAQRFLPLHVPPGQTYPEAWYLARPEEDQKRTNQYGNSEIRAGRSYQQEFRCRSKDGTQRWLSENVRVEVIGEGKWRCIGVCTDITAIKAAEIALRRANEDLEARVGERTAQIMEANAQLSAAKNEADRANLAKSEFLSRMSHELRTPLNSILGFGQILAREALKPLQKESVGYILKGGRHLLDLINEVLDIARVESGHIELSLEPLALLENIRDACDLVRPMAQERNILIDLNSVSFGRDYIRADRQRFKQVLINLLSNAIKYNQDGGQVRIYNLRESDGRCHIAIQDTGAGLTSEEQQKLFVPFERLNAAQAGIEGTGLGLTLSQRLVTAMGGALTLESVPGVGTTFFIELPLVPSPLEALAEHPIGTSEPASGSELLQRATVLYIEDNLSNVRLLEVMLRSRPGITLLPAMQGSVGLDLARQHAPDLILLDLNLPDISGKEVLARLQASPHTRDIPVVVLSADATASQIARLREAGARAYFTKPLDVTEFLDAMDAMLPPTKPGGSAHNKER